ncbi:hypothetical protein EV424DRAFT_1548583 [Suillus variegatus]|nr:hypothetical protein EV424DRAFT_1548583 [Suillus variegatus]
MAPAVDSRLAILTVLPASFVVITYLKRFIRNRRNKPHLPPGPVPLPLLGNVLSINTKEPWLTYTEWAATYGDLLFVRLLGQEVVKVIYVGQYMLVYGTPGVPFSSPDARMP